MKVVITADHAGFDFAQDMVSFVEELGVDVDYNGPVSAESVDFSDYGIPAAEEVAKGEYDRGIVICGTGIGMSISANKVKGVRCALVHDVYTSHESRVIIDSNVLEIVA